MEKLTIFDIARDIKIIEDGGFFCQACVVGKDKAAISSDPRYCKDCYDILREERERIRDSHSASMPKVLGDEGTEEASQSTIEEDTGGKS